MIGTMLPALREQALANRDDGTFCGLTRVPPAPEIEPGADGH